VTDDYVVLILMLQLQTLDSSRRPRKDKLNMVSETAIDNELRCLFASSFRLKNHIN